MRLALVVSLSVLALVTSAGSVATRNGDAVQLAAVADENGEGTAKSGNVTRKAVVEAEYGDCFCVCPTWTHVLVIGLVALLFVCLCGAVTQHQPREIWYVVDRSNEPAPPRPPSLPPRPSASQQRQAQIASP